MIHSVFYPAIILLTKLSIVTPFFIIKTDPGQIVVKPGDKVTLFCEVDEHYEYCKFTGPQKKPGSQENVGCKFEWKRSEDNITMQECDLTDKNVSGSNELDKIAYYK